LPSEETITNHRNQVVKVLAGVKIFLAILFVLGDQNAAIFLIFSGVLRLSFYFNPFLTGDKNEKPQTYEFKDESDPLTEGPIFMIKEEKYDYF
jgi:hypothetical protein